MTKLLIALLALFLVVALADDTWVRLEPEGVGFVVMMPVKPVEQVSQRDKVTTHAFIAEVDKSLYVASYGDYIPSVQINPEEELVADRDAFNKGLTATPLTSRSITLAGLPGIEFTSETSSATIRSQVFVRDHRVFQVAAIVPKDVDQAKRIKTFFESFAFTTKN